MTTKLPTADRPLTMDPDLAAALEDMLEPYEGEDLELAQLAVREVADSSFAGTWDALLEHYRDAIEEAVA